MIKYHLPVLFRRLDFSLMAAGVEGREPLSSYNLFINSLKYFPSDLISDEQGKIPLRSILSTFTSDSFALLKKIGFEVNLKDIFSISNNSINNYDFWREINLKVLS
jgi:asparagine synthase (glutamine-hydrolysing)